MRIGRGGGFLTDRQAPGRHAALDLLRGLAAIGVMLYHWLDWRWAIQVQSLGTFGVYLFFILSAIAMMIAYGRSFGETLDPVALAAFLRNRAARLLPLLIATAAAMLAIVLLSGEFALAGSMLDRTLLTGSGLMALGSPGYISTIGGGWSLGIEIAFYAVAPIAILLASRMRVAHGLLVLVILLTGQQLYLYSIAPITDPSRHWELFHLPIMFAPFFAMGFLIWRIGGDQRHVFLMPMLLCLAATLCLSLAFQGDLARSNAAFLVASALAAATVYMAYRTSLSPILERSARVVGDMSYALYLLHPVMFTLNTIATVQLGLGDAVRTLLDLAGTPIVAYLCFRWFERPLRDYLRANRAPPPVATLP